MNSVCFGRVMGCYMCQYLGICGKGGSGEEEGWGGTGRDGGVRRGRGEGVWEKRGDR